MKKFQFKSALLTMLVVGFVSLFAVGCGDSNNDFQTPVAPAGSGPVLFPFDFSIAAQTTSTPTSVEFTFYREFEPGTTSTPFGPFTGNLGDADGDGVADAVLVVSDEFHYGVATVLDQNGYPLYQAEFQFTVTPGARATALLVPGTFIRVILDPSSLRFNPDPVAVEAGGQAEFSLTGDFNTETGVTIRPQDATSVSTPTLVTVDNSGATVFVATAGNTTGTDTYQVTYNIGFSGPQTAEVDIVVFGLSLTPAEANAIVTPNADGGNYDGGWVVAFDNGTGAANVTTNLVYSLPDAPTFANITADTGIVTLSNQTTESSVTVQVEYTDPTFGATTATYELDINTTI